MSDFKIDPNYKDVPQRIADLKEKHPEASLQQVALDFREIDGKTWVIYTAACYRYPEDMRPGIGTAWEEYPGRTPYTKNSEVMNAETSAWGRAIVAALASESKAIASQEEIRSASSRSQPSSATDAQLKVLADALAQYADDAFNAWVNEFDKPLTSKDVDDILYALKPYMKQSEAEHPGKGESLREGVESRDLPAPEIDGVEDLGPPAKTGKTAPTRPAASSSPQPSDEIDAMNPPALMRLAGRLGVKLEGTTAQWREQLKAAR